jgi:hypothetical protein
MRETKAEGETDECPLETRWDAARRNQVAELMRSDLLEIVSRGAKLLCQLSLSASVHFLVDVEIVTEERFDLFTSRRHLDANFR